MSISSRYPNRCFLAFKLISISLFLLFAACSGDDSDVSSANQAPQILGFMADDLTPVPGQQILLSVEAIDPEGDSLTFSWTATGGAFEPSDQAETAWTAPEQEGSFTLTIRVSDPDGESASLDIPLSVAQPSEDLDQDGSPASEDCDDSDPTVFPGAPELADGLDNDCDSQVDEDSTLDADGDGFSSSQGDCDDSDPSVYAGAAEPVDGIDNDCNGIVDDGSSAGDDDRDGFSEDDGDCDDRDPELYPGATEIPDELDNDCDGEIDEGTELRDDDGDGFTELEGDCQDDDSSINPAAEEISNGVDDNCDGKIDEGQETQDLDQDGVTAGGGDCDDLNATIYPGAPELVDGADNDCDGQIDEGSIVYDDDGDAFTENEGDCDDVRADVYPGAVEVADELDNDCDGLVDEGTSIYDDDGDGYTEEAGDCDDLNVRLRPDYPEVPDGLDNDCDGLVDENTALSDQDGDGYTLLEGDCDDQDVTTYPGALDIPNDGTDNSCNDQVVNRAPVASADVTLASAGCVSVRLDASESSDPEGSELSYFWYLISGPASPEISAPTAVETDFAWLSDGSYTLGLVVSDGELTGAELQLELDSAALAEGICSADIDQDGSSASDGDCADDDPAIYPEAEELCDAIDQNCDGSLAIFDETFDEPLAAWTLYGDASFGEGQVLLTDVVQNQVGSVFYSEPLPLEHFTARVEFLVDGGNVGEGLTFVVLEPDSTEFLGSGGGGLGLLGLQGWAVEFDTVRTDAYDDPIYHHVAVDNPADLNSIAETQASIRTELRTFEISFDAGEVNISGGEGEELSATLDWAWPEAGYVGFTASTGSRTLDGHSILRFVLECR